jgi:hypothetical protein
LKNALYFVVQLLKGTEEVRIVLRKPTRPK